MGREYARLGTEFANSDEPSMHFLYFTMTKVYLGYNRGVCELSEALKKPSVVAIREGITREIYVWDGNTFTSLEPAGGNGELSRIPNEHIVDFKDWKRRRDYGEDYD